MRRDALRGPGLEVIVNGIMKLRVSLLSLGFGAVLALAPSAHAQAESNPDHFTETGVESASGGYTAQSATNAVAPARAKNSKPAVSVAHADVPAAPVHVAVAVADKNRPALRNTPKH